MYLHTKIDRIYYQYINYKMGVHDFFNIAIDKESSIRNVGKEVSLTDLAGQKICVDASLLIYNSMLALGSRDALTSADGKITGHIHILLNKICQIKKAGIDQIWIFDSSVQNEMKKRCNEKRAEQRMAATAIKGKDSKSTYVLNKQDVDDVQHLLSLMGIPYMTAPAGIEAEQLGAYMTTSAGGRLCSYMLSGDSDVICFGGNLLRTTRVQSGDSSRTAYFTYDHDKVLAATGLSRPKFLQMCCAMGTDFCDKADGVGAKTVLAKTNTGKYMVSPAQNMAAKYFASDISGRVNEGKLVCDKFNVDGLLVFLESLGFAKNRVDTLIRNSYGATAYNESKAGKNDVIDDTDEEVLDLAEVVAQTSVSVPAVANAIIELNILSHQDDVITDDDDWLNF
jgi:5'-3' exonuclease